MNLSQPFFIKTSEEQKQIFLQDSKRFEDMFQVFSDPDTLQAYYEQAQSVAVRSESSRKSDLPWGYYCPSPIFDLVVGNCHRGTLIKRKGKTPVSHQYFFDAQDQLVLIDHIMGEERYPHYYTFLIYQRMGVIGVEFTNSNPNTLMEIVKCTYQNQKIQSYIRAIPTPGATQKIHHYICEGYDYENQLLKTAYMYEYWFESDFMGPPQGYLFSHDEEGNFVDIQPFEWKQDKIVYKPTVYSSRIKNRKAWGYMPWRNDLEYANHTK